MMKITCLIIEDEPNAIKLLIKYIDQIPFLELKAECSEGKEALFYLSQENVDLIFLDINLPGISGIELSKVLSKYNIIFTTAHSEFAVEAYHLNAVDYLLKPISFPRFHQAVNKAINIIEHQKNPAFINDFLQDTAFIKMGKKIIGIEYSKIMYIEGTKEYIMIFTQDAKHMVYRRMKDIEIKLPTNFVRVHNSFIVNLSYISKIEDNEIILENKLIPISQKYKADFLKKIGNKML